MVNGVADGGQWCQCRELILNGSAICGVAHSIGIARSRRLMGRKGW